MKDIIKQIERKIDELKTLAHLANIEIEACTGNAHYDCELGMILRAYMVSCVDELNFYVDY